MAETKKPATVARYVSSMDTLHKAAGLDSPTKAPEVSLAIRRMNRAKGTRHEQAKPINRTLADRMLAQSQDLLRDLRDTAMLSLAYDSLCRRSEIVDLDVGDLSFDEDGSGIALVRRGKTDQEGAGSSRYLAPDTVDRVKAWLIHADIHQRALFRGVDRANVVGERLSSLEVARAFRRLAKQVGANHNGISGHSTRVGAAQDLIESGATIAETMLCGGWKSPEMPTRYTEKLAPRRGAMAKLAVKQRRT